MTKYISTRGQAPVLGFADVTLAGLALDGGLYVPQEIPALDISGMAEMPYLDVALRVIQPFVGGDIPPAELAKILQKAYSVFTTAEVAPLHTLQEGFFVQELIHGPTLAFKDVALQFLGHVFDYILAQKKKSVTIIGATSGDTGSAAIEAFRDKKTANIIILHPQGRVSEVQRRQMTTVLAPNVFNVAIEGSFDDCQDLVKAMFNDPGFRDEMQLSAVNSINWARILAQAAYYVYAGTRAQKITGKPTSFCVPTGNFGNVYAGYIAHLMGLPVEKFIVATNSNDILHRFFESGEMKSTGVAPTISPSMDIQISSNFERLLFDMTGRNGLGIAATMQSFREKGVFGLDAGAMKKFHKLFTSGRQSDEETLDVIRRIYAQHQYLLDPHSAVGVGVAESYRKTHPEASIVSLATAHPAKFPDAVKKAVGFAPDLPPYLADLYERKERYQVLPNDLAKVQAFVRASAGQKA